MFQGFVVILYTEDFILVGYFISNAKIVSFYVTCHNIDTLRNVDSLEVSSGKYSTYIELIVIKEGHPSKLNNQALRLT